MVTSSLKTINLHAANEKAQYTLRPNVFPSSSQKCPHPVPKDSQGPNVLPKLFPIAPQLYPISYGQSWNSVFTNYKGSKMEVPNVSPQKIVYQSKWTLPPGNRFKIKNKVHLRWILGMLFSNIYIYMIFSKIFMYPMGITGKKKKLKCWLEWTFCFSKCLALWRGKILLYKVPFKCIRNFLLVLYHEEDIMKNRSSREGKAWVMKM